MTISEKISVQEKRLAKQRAELARLRKQKKESERRTRNKSLILLGSVLESTVEKDHRGDLYNAVLNAEQNSADLRDIVVKLSKRLRRSL